MKQSFLTCMSLFDRMKTHFATNFALLPSLRRNSWTSTGKEKFVYCDFVLFLSAAFGSKYIRITPKNGFVIQYTFDCFICYYSFFTKNKQKIETHIFSRLPLWIRKADGVSQICGNGRTPHCWIKMEDKIAYICNICNVISVMYLEKVSVLATCNIFYVNFYLFFDLLWIFKDTEGSYKRLKMP